MDQMFQALIDRSRAPLDLKTIKTISGLPVSTPVLPTAERKRGACSRPPRIKTPR